MNNERPKAVVVMIMAPQTHREINRLPNFRPSKLPQPPLRKQPPLPPPNPNPPPNPPQLPSPNALPRPLPRNKLTRQHRNDKHVKQEFEQA